jgi:hypothetical protein
VQALQELGMHRKVQLIVSGGIRNGADVAKALALGADAVSIGTAALVALGDNDPALEEEYRKLGTTAGAYDDWHEGRDPAGITTQDPALAARLDPVLAGRRLANYLAVLTLEAQTIARACGKSHVHNLEPEDLVALTVEAAAMARCRWPAPTGFRERSLSNGGPNAPQDKGGSAKDMAVSLADRGPRARDQVFPDLLCRPVRRLAPSWCRPRDRRHGEGGRRLRRLRHLARHDAGRSRRVRDPRSGA